MLGVKSLPKTIGWTVSIVTVLGFAAIAVYKFGLRDKVAQPKIETKAGGESFADDFIETLLAKFDQAIPRLFPETKDLNHAIKNYRNAKTQAERTERAYDVFALKLQGEIRGNKITLEQQAAYDNAAQQIQWAGGIGEFYSRKIPESSIGTINLKFGSRNESISPDKAKKLLAATFSSSSSQCTEAQMKALQQNHDPELLAMNLPGLMKILLHMQIDINRQVSTAMKMPLLNSVTDENHRQVIESLYKIRDASVVSMKPEEETRKTILMEFLDGKNKELGFSIYADVPGCFAAKNVVVFLGMISQLKTELRAKFLLNRIRNGYKTKKVVPTEIDSLQIENPLNEREKFYSRASDGWGKTFDLKIENNYVTLKSSGKDREFGTADDFVAAQGPLDEAL